MAGDERVFVGVGANLGEAAAAVAAAITQLGALAQTTLVAASHLYRSAPLDATGPDYVNAVAELRTALEPEALLAQLQRLEQRFGRKRPHWHAPRTLDLDLLIYGQRRIDGPTLTVPHPRLQLRAFVLAPMAELAPALALAGGLTVCEALSALRDQRIERLIG